jgi:hypothetical protein
MKIPRAEAAFPAVEGMKGTKAATTPRHKNIASSRRWESYEGNKHP